MSTLAELVRKMERAMEDVRRLKDGRAIIMRSATRIVFGPTQAVKNVHADPVSPARTHTPEEKEDTDTVTLLNQIARPAKPAPSSRLTRKTNKTVKSDDERHQQHMAGLDELARSSTPSKKTVLPDMFHLPSTADRPRIPLQCPSESPSSSSSASAGDDTPSKGQ